MRLREPFSGYKLTSGHYLYHIAFLISSLLPMELEKHVNGNEDVTKDRDVMFGLKRAHLFVPILYVC